MSKQQINRIKKEIKISSFFDSKDLQKSSEGFKTTCPFHSEDTASFFITEKDDMELFHCFGCNKGGDIFSFLQLKENKTFSEILEDYGEKDETKPLKPRKKKTTFNYYHQLVIDCNTRFEEQIQTKKDVLDYLEKERKITNDDIKFFKLGYSEKGILHFLNEKNLSKEYAEEIGLIKKGDNGYYDIIKNRITIPIFNKDNIITGISTRSFLKTDTYGKYINPPNNKIFKKNSALYGINWSENEIREKDYVIIVEGYFDFITLYKNGFKNTVCVLGTNLFSEHVKSLSKLTKNFYFCFDKDLAGQQAIIKNIKECIKSGLNINVIEFPESKEKMDPDKYITVNGPDSFEKLIKNASSLVEFISKCGDNMIQILEDISYVIPKIESTITQQFWYKNILDIIGIDIRKDIKKEFFNRNKEKPLSLNDTLFLKTYINTNEEGKNLLETNIFLQSEEAIFLFNKLKNITFEIIFTESEKTFLKTIEQEKKYSINDIQKIIKNVNEENYLK